MRTPRLPLFGGLRPLTGKRGFLRGDAGKHRQAKDEETPPGYGVNDCAAWSNQLFQCGTYPVPFVASHNL